MAQMRSDSSFNDDVMSRLVVDAAEHRDDMLVELQCRQATRAASGGDSGRRFPRYDGYDSRLHNSNVGNVRRSRRG